MQQNDLGLMRDLLSLARSQSTTPTIMLAVYQCVSRIFVFTVPYDPASGCSGDASGENCDMERTRAIAIAGFFRRA